MAKTDSKIKYVQMTVCRSKEWIEMGVGRDITALGAARGCTDFPDWSLCNDPLLHEDVRKLYIVKNVKT